VDDQDLRVLARPDAADDRATGEDGLPVLAAHSGFLRRLDPTVLRSLDPTVLTSLDPDLLTSLDPDLLTSLDPDLLTSLDAGS
jgi:hypothetical protein